MEPALAVQETAELKLPMPWTTAEHWLVCPDWIASGKQEALTEVTGGVGAK